NDPVRIRYKFWCNPACRSLRSMTMKKAVLVLSVLMGVFALFAQVPDLSPLREGVATPQLESWIASGNSSNRQFSFNFDASPYNLPDSTDIQDPQTGLFLEDVAWTKDFSRHISNPESIPLTLSFLIPPTHFTVIQPDPENPLKLQFQPLPDN